MYYSMCYQCVLELRYLQYCEIMPSVDLGQIGSPFRVGCSATLRLYHVWIVKSM